MSLIWNAARRTYRDTDTGTFLSQDELTALRNAYAVQQGERVESLVDDFLVGATDSEVWGAIFQELIVHMMTAGYLFGRGGLDQMRDTDWEQLAYAIERQLDYAQTFQGDIVRGDVSPEQLRARATMYAGASVRVYEEGRAAAHEGLVLPTYPGDTDCKTNCRCTWIITEFEDRWECWWALEPSSNHCETCTSNAHQFTPYVVDKGAA